MALDLKYTDSFSVGVSAVEIKKAVSGDPVGGGAIPATIGIRAIAMIPTPSGGTFPDWWIKGTDPNSNWAKVPSEAPSFSIEAVSDSPTYCYVKVDTGTITLNLFVKGD